MAGQRIIRLLRRLVRTAASDKIDGNDPSSGCRKRRDHLSVQIGPGRVAVHQQDGLGVLRTHIDMMDADLGAARVAHHRV